MRLATLATLMVLTATPCLASAGDLTFDTSRYSQKVTGCDLLAAHPDDPFKVAPGVKQSQMDLPVAIAACEAAVARDPENPRLRYQLGRAYGYSGMGEKSAPHRAVAVKADYPQALFVIGYLHLEGLNKAQKDPCRAAELIQRGARYGRFASEVGYPMWALEGRFDGCKEKPDYRQMLGFLDAAQKSTSDFYQESLIQLLKHGVEQRLARARR